MSPNFEFVRSAIIEKICQAPPQKRKKLIDKIIGTKKKPKKTKRFDFDKQGKWSKELISEVLKDIFREHKKLTTSILNKLRKENPKKYPPPSTVCLRFGSWENAKKAIGAKYYHENLLGDNYEEDVGYFLSLYHQFGLVTKTLYIEGRRKYPQVVPAYSKLKEIFGSFRTFKKVAKLDSCTEQIERLIVLINNLGGRWPRRPLCKEHGIDIKYLDARFGSRKELKEFVRDLRKAQKN